MMPSRIEFTAADGSIYEVSISDENKGNVQLTIYTSPDHGDDMVKVPLNPTDIHWLRDSLGKVLSVLNLTGSGEGVM